MFDLVLNMPLYSTEKKGCESLFFQQLGQVIQEWGPSKICGRQPLENMRRYGLPKQIISLQIL